ncbi:acetyl-CoA synthetase [Flexivirga endophytica]|uniref:Acetyl-CoA synthetase n=1 Tax=Flexivirga endophytica TaxID=1849103 RepID=A0A916T440_9MICO|nr:AMP-binding protein [Flexivirga endophytica]GGB31246.1 acetyl-CoA synthetase [Flexivirga endophytica]GHB52173.1 acetyl-CoA synthetase [Flexivirga endophytica]
MTDLSPSGYRDSFARDHLPPREQWPTLEFTTDLLRYPARLNAAVELLDIPTEKFGADRPAIKTPDGEVWTYGELRQRTNQLAGYLTDELGLVTGNRVLLRSPNNPWTMAAWLAVLKAGGVVVTTMAALRAREIAPIVEKTSPAIALVDHRFADAIHELRATVAPDLKIATYGGGGTDDLARLIADKPTDFTAVDTAADDVALLGPTSGSTGVPKITMHFHRDIMSIDNTFGRTTLCLEPDDLVACTAPFAFTFGLGMLVVFPLRAGACAFLTESATPAELAEMVEAHAITSLATAPTAYKQILKSGNAAKLRTLRTAVSAGEHIQLETWHEVHEQLGLKIIDGIGATEMLHIFITAAGDDIREGSTGKPVPGYRAIILDADGNEAAPGVAGRLGVIGPVGCRYLADDRQRGYVMNGWNLTGDTFSRDEDGYFWYQARTDNMIVSSGYNIGGPEVEAALEEHPDVVESAVVAKPDTERGSIVCAFVVLRDGVPRNTVKVKEIQDFVKGHIAPYKYPREVRFVDALPRNASGKLQHFRLRDVVNQEATR